MYNIITLCITEYYSIFKVLGVIANCHTIRLENLLLLLIKYVFLVDIVPPVLI